MFIALLFALCVAHTSAISVYISPFGDDNGNGDADDPFQSVQRAVSAVDKSSDLDNTIFVGGGQYLIPSVVTLSKNVSIQLASTHKATFKPKSPHGQACFQAVSASSSAALNVELAGLVIQGFSTALIVKNSVSTGALHARVRGGSWLDNRASFLLAGSKHEALTVEDTVFKNGESFITSAGNGYNNVTITGVVVDGMVPISTNSPPVIDINYSASVIILDGMFTNSASHNGFFATLSSDVQLGTASRALTIRNFTSIEHQVFDIDKGVLKFNTIDFEDVNVDGGSYCKSHDCSMFQLSGVHVRGGKSISIQRSNTQLFSLSADGNMVLQRFKFSDIKVNADETKCSIIDCYGSTLALANGAISGSSGPAAYCSTCALTTSGVSGLSSDTCQA